MWSSHGQRAEHAEPSNLINGLRRNSERNRNGTRQILARFHSVPVRFRSPVPFPTIEKKEEFR